MPYFTTVEGKFTQLCVHAAQDQPCPDKKCEYSHEPRNRRICPMFHNPKERCPFNPCLLGHDEARDTLKASKAFGRCQRLAKEQETLVREETQGQRNEVQNGKVTPNQDPNPNAQPQNNQPGGSTNEGNQAETQNVAPQNVPPVHFENLIQENNQVGQRDEMARIYLMTESLKQDMENFKRQAAEKEAAKDMEVRTLQEAMGAMQDENLQLKQENESKPSVLDSYDKTVFENPSNTNALVNLNVTPPSELAVEGALVILSTMYVRPVEFEGATNVIDFFTDRPSSKFSDQMATLTSLGLTVDHPEHAFFLRCYMRYPTDPSFCQNRSLDSAASVVTLPPGGAVAPRASVLKHTPRKFRKIFLAQQASQQVTETANASLSIASGGGLSEKETLPSEVHVLLARFCTRIRTSL
jgi:hypothetical protein